MEDRLHRAIEDKDAAYTELYEFEQRQEDRYDSLLAKQEQILDQRLGLNQEKPVADKQLKPIGHNRNWQKDYEARKRGEYWKKVVEDVEKKDGPLSPVAADKAETK